MQSSTAVGRIGTIALNTFREAVRDRVLYNLVLFVLLITASAVFLGEITAGNEARVIVNLGLSAVLLFGTFIAIFVGIGLVSKEIEKRTIYAMFAKPITRGEFVIGKYFGLCLTILVNVAVMGIGISLALLYVSRADLAGSIWGAVVLIFFELMVITAVAILFSSFSSPALSALFTFAIFIIGHFSKSLHEFAETLASEATKRFFEVLYYLMPNFAHFSFITNSAYGDTPPFEMLAFAAAYAVIYSAVLVWATVIIFKRRNFV
jgi:ABC-type transport system involved in multi-copper enzyme maturation permease subunit